MKTPLDRLKQVKRLALNSWLAYTPIAFYGQHGEDKILDDMLREFGFRPSGGIDYIDVGANQPAVISNTFRMYRQGFKGLLVEPNANLTKLLKRLRPRDIVLPIGCGAKSGLAGFMENSASVLGTLNAAATHGEATCVLTLDQISDGLKIKELALLSIDVEGMNMEVLRGAKSLLAMTRIVVVEFDTDAEKAEMLAHLRGEGFSLRQAVACNLIFCRQASPA